MVVIDCANDDDLAAELGRYMSGRGMEATVEGSAVTVQKEDVEQIIGLFLKETDRQGYTMRRIDSDNFLLSREVPIEEFGFLQCEMCGYVVSNEEELVTHRRAHGIQLL